MERGTLGRWLSMGAWVGLAGCGGAAPAMDARGVKGEVIAAPSASNGAVKRAVCARTRSGGATRAPGPMEGGAAVLARIGDRTIAYTADADDDAIHTFDVDRAVEIAVTPLAGAPSQILVLADGRVAVTITGDNRVAMFEPGDRPEEPLTPLCDAAALAEPWGIAATPDGARLVVTHGWARALTVLDASSLEIQRRTSLARDPRGVVVDDDGKRAFVTHMVGARLSVVDLEGPESPVHTVFLRPDDAGHQAGTYGFGLARVAVQEGAPPRIFAPIAAVNPGRREASFGYGGTLDTPSTRPLVAVVDPIAERVIGRGARVDVAHHRRDCLLPRAVAATKNGTVIVACQGIDAIVEMDARSIDPASVERRRFRVPSGPTGLAIDEAKDRAVVWSAFARELAIVDLGPDARPVVRVPGARKQASRLTAEEQRGRALFHATDDPRVARDGRACASCHPDGRDDALTWSTPDGPRQTIMLAGRVAESPPYGWFGKHRSLRDHVTQSVARLGGSGFTKDADRADMDALIAYLRAMRGPALDGAARDPAREKLAARGRELFGDERLACAKCHYGGGSDGAKHDVKSGDVDERSLRFDTPSLRFVGGTAPYFHDGRYATMEELLEKSDGRMGHTIQLSRPDLLALAAYLEAM